jgi:hypothetical protein
VSYVPVLAKRNSRPKRRSRPNSVEDHVIKILVSPTVMGALAELRQTGLFGNGEDVESVVEELLRIAVRSAIETGNP